MVIIIIKLPPRSPGKKIAEIVAAAQPLSLTSPLSCIVNIIVIVIIMIMIIIMMSCIIGTFRLQDLFI